MRWKDIMGSRRRDCKDEIPRPSLPSRLTPPTMRHSGTDVIQLDTAMEKGGSWCPVLIYARDLIAKDWDQT